MIGQEPHEVERKVLAILEILSCSKEPMGGRMISRRLQEKGIGLCERAVRYHLEITDKRGFTHIVGRRDGRVITLPGLVELRSALVCDKIGFLTSRIELLAYLTTFDINTHIGDIPIDISLFAEEDSVAAFKAMRAIFKAGLCVSNLITKVSEEEKLGEVFVPKGKIGLATVSNIAVSGLLLKSGIPLHYQFTGLVEMHDFLPYRFVEFMQSQCSTIDPQEIFITSKMTTVSDAAKKGEGRVLASLYEIPIISRPATEAVLEKLKAINLCNLWVIGNTTELTCKIPVNSNKLGLVILSGLNPVAAAAEEGINVTNRVMGGVIDSRKLKSFSNS